MPKTDLLPNTYDRSSRLARLSSVGHLTEEEKMKYIISWFERPQGSPVEYEIAQKRILEAFGQCAYSGEVGHRFR